MSESPVVVLYDASGLPVCIVDGYDVTLVSGQKGIISAGITAAGIVKFLSVGNNGALNVISNTSGRNIIGEYLIGTGLIDGYIEAQNLLSMENPVGSNRIIYLSHIEITGTVINSSLIIFSYEVRRTIGMPELGTILNSQKRSSSDLDAAGVVRLGPSAAPQEGVMWATTVGTGEFGKPIQSNVFHAINTEVERHEIVLKEGEGILISCGANSADWLHWINLTWDEEAL
jgi:hypothetical protein